MTVAAREFIDFWIENSIHAAEPLGLVGGSQDVAELARRCVDMARSQGVTELAMQGEAGDVAGYIREKLAAANRAEIRRQDRR